MKGFLIDINIFNFLHTIYTSAVCDLFFISHLKLKFLILKYGFFERKKINE